MSKTNSHTGALYAKISGEYYMMEYSAKDVVDLRNTLKFHGSLMVKQQAKIEEQGAQIQKLLTEKIELCAKVEELQTEITDIQWKQAKGETKGMSNEKKSDGGLAFPMWDGEEQEQHYGLTKREWFAGMALIGLLESRTFLAKPEAVACQVYEYADAILKEGVK